MISKNNLGLVLCPRCHANQLFFAGPSTWAAQLLCSPKRNKVLNFLSHSDISKELIALIEKVVSFPISTQEGGRKEKKQITFFYLHFLKSFHFDLKLEFPHLASQLHVCYHLAFLKYISGKNVMFVNTHPVNTYNIRDTLLDSLCIK